MGKWLRNSICGAAMFFSVNFAFADSATFFWDFGAGATPQTSTQQNPTGILFSSTGAKSVTLTVNRFGCTATITKNVSVTNVISGNKITICHKGNTISVSQNALQAHLNHGDCIGACNTTGARFSNESVEATPSAEIILTAIPNPFSEKTEIEFMTDRDEEISIEAYNYSGQLVRQLCFAKTEAGKKSKIMFDAHGLSKGMYFIKAQTTSEVRIIKLVLIQ
ncbi:MAG: T9SS type A sorting domain-containing protein [Bacteroidetes bacterium]|nr:T9SS type A sorting domain-containing protein [Bacteroidota bacterium]